MTNWIASSLLTLVIMVENSSTHWGKREETLTIALPVSGIPQRSIMEDPGSSHHQYHGRPQPLPPPTSGDPSPSHHQHQGTPAPPTTNIRDPSPSHHQHQGIPAPPTTNIRGPQPLPPHSPPTTNIRGPQPLPQPISGDPNPSHFQYHGTPAPPPPALGKTLALPTLTVGDASLSYIQQQWTLAPVNDLIHWTYYTCTGTAGTTDTSVTYRSRLLPGQVLPLLFVSNQKIISKVITRVGNQLVPSWGR